MDPTKRWFRLLILLFNCLLTFGGYFAYDLPSVLESTLEKELGLTGQSYSLLMILYNGGNLALVVFGGILTDKLGTTKSSLAFTLIVLVGNVLFAAGTTAHALAVMLIGRFVFGMGLGSLTVVQNTISGIWFRDRELSLAFGTTLTASRLGSVANFYLTGAIVQSHGLGLAVWLAVIFCGLSVLAALAYTFLERKAAAGDTKGGGRKLNFREISKFPAMFWLLSVVCMLYYCLLFPFVAFATEYFQQRWGLPLETVGMYTGIVYFLSIFLAPILGLLLDYTGRRAVLIVVASSMTVPVFILLAFTMASPVVAMVVFGVSYSLMASALWSSVPLIITDDGVTGTAYGVMTAIQMLGQVVWNYAVGLLKDALGPLGYMMLFVVCSGVTVGLSVWLLVLDGRRGGAVNAKGALDAPPCPTGSFSHLTASAPGLSWVVSKLRRRRRGYDVPLAEDETHTLLGQTPFETSDV